MTDFEWKPEYALGHFQIDDEHRKLFRLANKMLLISSARATDQDIRAAIKTLSDYTKIHFRNEENLMKSINYPKLEEHRAAHERIIDQINRFMDIGSSPQRQVELLKETINNWISEHTTAQDLEVARFIANRRSAKV